jgi:tRNA 5-methylaminomethyl-2-thiouridine biosynthesis bifunctional protein
MPASPLVTASTDLLARWQSDPFASDPDQLAALLNTPESGLESCLRQQHSATVVDLHFGIGLAFLLTCQRFAALRQEGGAQRLHYVAIVPHPCDVAQLAQVHATWPHLHDLALQLQAVWPLPLPGTHRLTLCDGAVTLTLVLGELDHELSRLDAPADLFYLHADPARFDPAAAQWNAHQCKRIARQAWTGAHVLVYEGDQAVAQAMRQSGFVAQPLPSALALHYAPGWARPGTHVTASDTPLLRQPQHARHALVIGAGMAGCAAAERLSARGWRIDLIDACDGPAQRASGNHGGLFMPALARDESPLARLSRAAYLYALNHWQQLGGVGLERTEQDGVAGELCGVLQLGRDAKQARSFEQAAAEWNYPQPYARWLSQDQSAALLGMPVPTGGYLFERAGWLNPPSLCRRLLALARVQAPLQEHFGRTVSTLTRNAQGWQALDAGGGVIATAPVVIIAAGAQARALPQSAGLPLQAVRGQVSHLAADDFPVLPVAMCGDGYLTRAYQGQLCIGASYDRDPDPAMWPASHAENLQRLQNMLPQISTHYDLPPTDAPASGRVGFRCIAPDRLPLAGPLPTGDAADTGLYSLLGYASRGLIWAPLMAELLAAMLEREPLPLPRELVAAVDPGRFGGRRLE